MLSTFFENAYSDLIVTQKHAPPKLMLNPIRPNANGGGPIYRTLPGHYQTFTGDELLLRGGQFGRGDRKPISAVFESIGQFERFAPIQPTQIQPVFNFTPGNRVLTMPGQTWIRHMVRNTKQQSYQ